MAGDRLSAQDASFLHIESSSAHMHVASVMLFEGPPPPYDDLLEAIERRLGLVPRYRQRLAFVPLGQGRPRWVDDPHLEPSLPRPRDGASRRRGARASSWTSPAACSPSSWTATSRCGSCGSWRASRAPLRAPRQDPPRPRGRRLGHGHRFRALRHFDPSRPRRRPRATLAARAASERSQLLGRGAARTRDHAGRGGAHRPRRLPAPAAGARRGSRTRQSASARWPGPASTPRPRLPTTATIGPHRRFTWIRAELGDVKAIKDSLGGTVNDVVLATVAGGLGRHLRRRGETTDGLELKAMIPVSVRSEVEQGALGNQRRGHHGPAPGVVRGAACAGSTSCARSWVGSRSGGQAVGAQMLTDLSGFAPPTIMDQAARLMSRQRFFNLVVTNVPGPQFPLYLAGRACRPVPDGPAGRRARGSG